MTPITLTLIKLAFLAVLWLFVIAAVGVIRADLFGSKAATRAARPRAAARPAQQSQAQAQAPAPAPARGRRNEPGKLVVTQGELAGTTFDLNPAVPITIGRANDSTLVLSDDYASSRHARIYAQDGRWFVQDLGSTNGTYLGSRKISQPEPVPAGVQIRIGKTVLVLRK